ncbi:MAG TPA: RluA family pseudouridine synthase [Firmicutes bacterium]|nr:RluA family pseudouridine synthase [Candidatus Fermentithermobacillaceae bacterium]
MNTCSRTAQALSQQVRSPGEGLHKAPGTPITLVLRVDETHGGERLDVFVAKMASGEGLSRTRAQGLIEEGNIRLNGLCAKPSTKVKPGDVIDVTVPPPEEWDVAPEEIPIDVVYEDADVLVINKARGMVVHPAAGHWQGTLVNAILAHCPDLAGIGGEVRPGIVHRLDKGTTGLMVVAKNDGALKSLQDQIKARKVKRVYIALCVGEVRNDAGTVDAPIGRHPVHRKKMAVVPTGRSAVTDYEVLARFSADFTLLLAKLRTGRTHQIRVHMAHLGHPVAGDPVYGRVRNDLGLEGQALHALVLGFDHPVTGERLEFSAPLPRDFEEALGLLFRKYPSALDDLRAALSAGLCGNDKAREVLRHILGRFS